MGITVEQGDESIAVCLEGVIDIASAAELKAALLDALKPAKAVRVALAGNADLDVTAIQLLWAAERAARGSGVPFKLDAHAPVTLSAVMKDAGFEGFPVPV
jgi:anti-anti-sigma regulatory factor